MLAVRVNPRRYMLEAYDRQPDTVTMRLQQGRAYDRCVRQVVNAVTKKTGAKEARGLVTLAVNDVNAFTDYADYEHTVLWALGPNATPGKRDAAIARAARAWRKRAGTGR